MYIKWKTTAVYWILAIVFFVTAIFSKKTLLQHILKENIEAPKKA